MTLLAVAIAGGTIAVAGWVIESLSIQYAQDSFAQRVALVTLGAAVSGLVLTTILLVVLFPDADEGAVLGGLIAGYVGGSVVPLLDRYLTKDQRTDFGELAQLATQVLLGCTGLLVGAAIGLQL